MPSNTYSVNLAIRADTKQLRTSLNKAKRQWKTFGSQINGIGKGIGVAMAAASAVAVVGLGSIIRTGKQFEQSMSELSAITGATGKNLDNLGKAARNMAKVSSFSAGQAATAFKLVASAKPDLLESAAALTEVTKSALTLAEAARIDLPTAANALGSALNQFGAGAKEASRFINVLAAGSKFGAASIADVSIALKNSGVVASTLNVTFEQTNAALQVLGASAIKGGEAGTKLRGVLLKLEQAGGNYSVITHGLSGALQNLARDELSVIELTKLFGLENVVAGKILAKNAETVEDLTKKLTGTNIAFEQSSIQMDNLSGDALKLRSAVDELLIRIFTDGDVGKSFRQLTQDVTDFINSISTEAIDNFGKAIRNTIDTLVEYRGVILKVTAAWIILKGAMFSVAVVAAIISFTKAMKASSVAISAFLLLNPVTALLAASAALLTLGIAIGRIIPKEKQFSTGIFIDTKRITNYNNALRETNKTFDDQAKRVEGLQRLYKSVNEQTALRARLAKKVSNEVRIAAKEEIKYAKSAKEANEELEKAIKDVTQQFEWMREGQQELHKLRESTNPDVKLWNRYEGAIELARGEIDKYAEAQKSLREAFAAGIITQEEFQKVSLNVARAASEAANKTADETVKATDRMGEIWKHAIQRMQDAVADLIHESLWEKGIKSFNDFTDTLLKIWKKVISEIIAAWATSGITGLLRGAGLLAGSGAATSAIASSVGSSASSTIGSTASSIGLKIGNVFKSQILKGFTFVSSAISNFALGLPLSGIGGGLGNALLSGFGAGGSILSLLNPATIAANAALAGGGIAATIGAAIPAVAIAFAAASIFDKLTGGSLFGGKTKLKDAGVEFVTRGDRLNASSFGKYKRKGGLFSSTKRFTNYQDLPDEALEALRQANRNVFNSVKGLLETFDLSANGIRDFSIRLQITLKDLDDAAKEQAIADAFSKVAEEMLQVGLAANGLVIPVESAANAMEKLTEAAKIIQVAAQRAELIASGRIDTVSVLQRSLVNATNVELQKLLTAAQEEITSSGSAIATTIAESIQAELIKRADQANAANVVARILESAKIAIEGINDLSILALAATEQAFSFVKSALTLGGEAISSATLKFADAVTASALASVARITSITEQIRAGSTEQSALPGFQFGGIVPGRRGMPVLAVVHGGEEIIPANQRSQGLTINVNQTVTGDADSVALRALRNNAREFAVIIQDEIVQQGLS